MNKSMQTSGGTVLSTNWGEVSEKDHEKVGWVPNVKRAHFTKRKPYTHAHVRTRARTRPNRPF